MNPPIENLSLWLSTGSVFLFFLTALVLLTVWKVNDNEKNYTAAILLLCIGVFVALSLAFYKFIVDDVYISLRYARNLANGEGLVFNTDGSRPVEGYTNFLWVVLEAGLFLLKIPDATILHIIKILGIAFGAGVLIITFFLTKFLTSSNRISLTAVLFLAAVPEMAMWAVGGLETPMYMFWMFLGIYRYMIEKRKGKPHIWSMVFVALMALTRPEGLFFGIAIILIDIVWTLFDMRTDHAKGRQHFRQILTGLLMFTVLYAGYFLWRYNFYGDLFPNTFYAKKMTSLQQMFDRVKQVSSFMAQLFPFFSIACLGYLHFNKNTSRERLVISVLMLLLMSFCFVAKSEWMPGFRYELPFVPLLMLFFAAGVNRMLFSELKEQGARWKTQLTRFGALFFLGLYLIYPFNNLRLIGDSFGDQLHRAHVGLGKWLKEHAPQDASYASWDMGAIPYYSELPKIIDINAEGLLNRHTTMYGYDIDYLLSLNPSFLVLPPNTSYVRPRIIRDFYEREALRKNYEFLFTICFTKEYVMHVYKNRNVVLSANAIKEGKDLAHKSMLAVNEFRTYIK